jgi:hypothetical protein
LFYSPAAINLKEGGILGVLSVRSIYDRGKGAARRADFTAAEYYYGLDNLIPLLITKDLWWAMEN